MNVQMSSQINAQNANRNRIYIPVICLLLAAHAVCAAPFAHRGQVSSVAAAGQSTFFTAGEDGFVAKWSGNQSEHYQIGTAPIKLIAANANGTMLAIYESDGVSVNRVSVWDWTSKKRKFARKFNDPVTSLSFAPRGGYIVVSALSASGVVFLSADSGSVLKKIKTSLGATSYAAMSATEKTMFTYSKQGRASAGRVSGVITYVDMKTGAIKMNKGKQLRFNTDAKLEQASLFHNNVFLAGVEGGAVKIVAADTGVVTATFNADNPVILQDSSSMNLCYTSGGTLMFVPVEGRNIGKPRAVSPIALPNDSVTSGASFAGFAMFGTGKGNVYLANTDSASIAAVTQSTQHKILDAAPHGKSFYFLTSKSVIQSSYDDSAIARIAYNDGKTNMTVWDEGIILWSRGALRPVVLLDTSHGNMALDSTGDTAVEIAPKVLFTPSAAINSLHVSGGKIIYVEGNRDVKAFDISMMQGEDICNEQSAQDAVMAGGAVYVSTAKNSASPLVKVDLVTHEAVPIKMSAGMGFSLVSDGSYIYGARLSISGSEKKTAIFSYNIATGMSNDLISYAADDRQAFVSLENGRLLTNIGGTAVLAYNTVTRKNITLSRAASLPLASCAASNRIAVVGKDGTVSWYSNDSASCIATWSLMNDGGALSWSEG